MHDLVEVAVVFDGVAVGVEEGGVPVAQGFVAFGAVEGQAYVAAGKVEFRVLAGEDDHGCLGIRAVVAGSGFRHVNDRGVVEHRAVALGDGFELGDEGFDLLHVVSLHHAADVVGSATQASVTDGMDAGLFLVFGQGADVGGEVVDGVSHDVG